MGNDTRLITAVSGLKVAVDKLCTALGIVSVENPAFIAAQKQTVTTAGTPVQLPLVLIPYDKEVVIKALSTNGGTIYVGNSDVEAGDHTLSYPLDKNETIGYKIKNLHQLWIDAAVSGEGITWTVEREER